MAAARLKWQASVAVGIDRRCMRFVNTWPTASTFLHTRLVNALSTKRRIRIALAETGLDTFARLAVAAQVHPSKLSRAVNGLMALSDREKARIAAALRRSPADLFSAAVD